MALTLLTYINPSIEFFFIIGLLVYIVYLQLQLVKKNTLLKTFYDRIDRPDSKLNKDDIIRFLENIKNPDYAGIVTKDKFLDKKINSFLFENENEIKLFLHYTPSEHVANKIIREGFKFVNSFYKTAEYIFNDELYLIQRHHEHKQFGDFVIVICISKSIYNKFSDQLSKLRTKNIAVEQILTEQPVYKDENSEDIYTLPTQFVKGYFNYKNGIIIANPAFNPNYFSEAFNNNLQNIKEN